MSGFFRQLAEQTLQPNPLLRPATTQPFTQTNWIEEPERETPRPGVRSATVDDEASSKRSAQTQVTGPRAGHAVFAEEVGVEAPRDSRAAGRRIGAEPAAQVAGRDAVGNMPASTQSETTAAAAVPAAVSYPEPVVAHTRTVEADRRLPIRPGPRRNPESPAARTVPVIARPPTPIPGTAGSESRRHRPAIDAAPDVHIHIGRIELIAATSPTAPRRTAAKEKKPMSLDEYLQMRRKDAP